MDDRKYRKIFTSLPEIQTERLILKKIGPENAFDMHEYASLDIVTEYLLWSPHFNIAATRGYIEYLQREYKKGNYADWGLNLKSNGKFIGTVGFANIDIQNNNGEIGYVLSPSFQGMGYMKEAIQPVLDIAFSHLGMKRLQARIMEGNRSSELLIKSCGFKFEGTLRSSLLVKDRYRTINIFSLLDSEYFATK